MTLPEAFKHYASEFVQGPISPEAQKQMDIVLKEIPAAIPKVIGPTTDFAKTMLNSTELPPLGPKGMTAAAATEAMPFGPFLAPLIGKKVSQAAGEKVSPEAAKLYQASQVGGDIAADEVSNKVSQWTNKYADWVGIPKDSFAAQLTDMWPYFFTPGGEGILSDLPTIIDQSVTRAGRTLLTRAGYAGAATANVTAGAAVGAGIDLVAHKFGMPPSMFRTLLEFGAGAGTFRNPAIANAIVKAASGMPRADFMEAMKVIATDPDGYNVIDSMQKPVQMKINDLGQEFSKLQGAGKDTAKVQEQISDLTDKLKIIQNQRGLNKFFEDSSRYFANVGVQGLLGTAAGAAFGGITAPTGGLQQGMAAGAAFGGPIAFATGALSAAGAMRANRIAYGNKAFVAIGSHNFDMSSIANLPPEAQNYILAFNGAARTAGRELIPLDDAAYDQARAADDNARAARATAAGQPVSPADLAASKAMTTNAFIDLNGNGIIKKSALQEGAVPHEVTHMTQEMMGQMLGASDPELMDQFAAALAKATGRPEARLSPEALRSERDAEVGRILLEQTPLGAFYGGARTGDILARVARSMVNWFRPNKVDPVLKAPYSPADLELMRRRYLEFGRQAQMKRFALAPPTEGAPMGPGGRPMPPPVLTPDEEQVLHQLVNVGKQINRTDVIHPQSVGQAIVDAKFSGQPVTIDNITNKLLFGDWLQPTPRGPQAPPPVTPQPPPAEPKPPPVTPQPPPERPLPTRADYQAILDKHKGNVRAAIEEAAQLHREAVGEGSDLISWYEPQKSITGTRADPNDPFHQLLLERAKLSPEAVQNLNNLEANIGRGVTVDYSGAPGQVGAGKTAREAAQAEAPAPARAAGKAATEAYSKSFVPTRIEYNPVSNVFEVHGQGTDKLLQNADKVINWVKENKPVSSELDAEGKPQPMKTFTDVNDPDLLKYVQQLNENYRNGYTASGRPIKGTADYPVEVNPDYPPHVIPKDLADQINVMYGNVGARLGKGKTEATEAQAAKQALRKANLPYYISPEGEVNKLREQMPREFWKDLHSAATETVRPELAANVRAESAADRDVRYPSGFVGDRRAFAAQGVPPQGFVAANLMAATRRPDPVEFPGYYATAHYDDPAMLDKAIGASANEGSDVVSSTPDREVLGMGFDMDKIITLLGAKMYEKPLSEVATKEMLQNAFDTSRHAGATPENPKRIDIDLDPDQRTITVTDRGLGMDKDIIKKAFLTIGGSYKGGSPENNSGGLGVAKMAFLLGSDRVRVETVKGGTLHVMDVSKEDIANKRFPIDSTPTDLPNGTKVMVQIPESYVDSNGETKSIWFHEDPYFLRQPLLGPVEVYKNGELQPMGVHTPTEGLQKDNVFNFGWGHIDVYVDPRKQVESPDFKVLSAGLHQFDLSKYDIFGFGDDPSIKYNMVFDVRPKVRAGEVAYPFNNQREGWSNAIKNDVQAMYTYLKGMGLEQRLLEAKDVFSKLKQLPEFDPTKDLTQAQIDKINEAYGAQRKAPELKGRKVTSIDFTPDKVVTRYATGRPTTIKREEYVPESFQAKRGVNIGATKLDVSNLDPQKPYLHNNTSADYSDIAGEPQLTAKLGNALIKFMREWGDKVGGYYGDLAKTDPSGWFGGISYDKTYRGLNTVNPFKAIWFNPAFLSDVAMGSPKAAAAETLHIFLHEITHVAQRNEGSGFTAEFATNAARARSADVALEKFEAALNNIYADHWDTLHEIADRFQNRNTENVAASFKRSAALGPQPEGERVPDEGVFGVNAPRNVPVPEQGFGGLGRTPESNPAAGPIGEILAGQAAAERRPPPVTQGRIGSPGLWDTLQTSGQAKELAEQLGVDPKKRFYEQKPEAQNKITNYFVRQEGAQFMPSTHRDAIDDVAIKTPDGKVHTGWGMFAKNEGMTEEEARKQYGEGGIGGAIHSEIADQLGGEYDDEDIAKSIDGFVTKSGQFFDRKQALDHASAIGQLTREEYVQDRAKELGIAPEQVRNLETFGLERHAKFMAATQRATPLTLDQINTGISSGDIPLVGAFHIAHGADDYRTWSRRMLQEYGPEIKPRLRDVYADAVQAHAENAVDAAWGLAGQHFTPEQRAGVKTQFVDRVLSIFKEFDPEATMRDVQEGKYLKGWYQHFTGWMTDLFGSDAARFSKVFGTFGANTPPLTNTIRALDLWTKWIERGRPTATKAIDKLVEDVMITGAGKELGRTAEDIQAWRNNIRRALQSADPATLRLSGPKVDPYSSNILGNLDRATLDRHMGTPYAIQRGMEPKSVTSAIFGTRPETVEQPMVGLKRPKKETIGGTGFAGMAYEAHLRQVAKMLGDDWKTANVQEAIWGKYQPLKILADEMGVPVDQLLKGAVKYSQERLSELKKAISPEEILGAEPVREKLRGLEAARAAEAARGVGRQGGRAGVREAPKPYRSGGVVVNGHPLAGIERSYVFNKRPMKGITKWKS
jgi:anti-sigma regulatory factor (Ser/Thr protein kinase)